MEQRELGQTGSSVPIIGLGTSGIGGGMRSDRSEDSSGISALQYGLDLGMRLIDTAEMYGAGHSEEVVAKAIAGRREDVFLATKVSPQHFHYEDVLRSAKKSLERLQVGQVDLYQLHWPNPSVPISETMRAMEKLVQEGLVRQIGVSNFSVQQVKEAQSSLSHARIVSNQVEYSLLDRSPEANGVLDQCRRERISLIAYSPLGQGRLSRGKGEAFDVLDQIAGRIGRTRAQVALNWVLRNEPVITIPKAGLKEHVKENSEAAGWSLSQSDSDQLKRAFQ